VPGRFFRSVSPFWDPGSFSNKQNVSDLDLHPSISGQALVDLLNYAKENEFAIPGVNVVSSSSVNACMEAAKKAGGPVMVTFSRGGGQLLGTEVLYLGEGR